MRDEFNIKNTNNKHFYFTPYNLLKRIEIPPGCYEYSELNEEVKVQLINNGDACTWYSPISFIPNNATFKIDLKLEKGFLIDFIKQETFREPLGFNARIVGGENITSDFKPDIRSSIDN